jgi:hypothetical protein
MVNDMTLQFRAGWNTVPPAHANADDAAMIPLLNPDETTVRVVMNEAYVNGAFTDARVLRMFAAAASDRGAIVSVRAGAHQLEDLAGGGFRLHIGTLFEGVNFHLNLAQTNRGTMYVTSISWGSGANHGSEVRPGPAPA